MGVCQSQPLQRLELISAFICQRGRGERGDEGRGKERRSGRGKSTRARERGGKEIKWVKKTDNRGGREEKKWVWRLTKREEKGWQRIKEEERGGSKRGLYSRTTIHLYYWSDRVSMWLRDTEFVYRSGWKQLFVCIHCACVCVSVFVCNRSLVSYIKRSKGSMVATATKPLAQRGNTHSAHILTKASQMQRYRWTHKHTQTHTHHVCQKKCL